MSSLFRLFASPTASPVPQLILWRPCFSVLPLSPTPPPQQQQLLLRLLLLMLTLPDSSHAMHDGAMQGRSQPNASPASEPFRSSANPLFSFSLSSQFSTCLFFTLNSFPSPRLRSVVGLGGGSSRVPAQRGHARQNSKKINRKQKVSYAPKKRRKVWC
ncbi:uncharacterized protein PV09_01390 [Verruconis gallopava]|uniref:Uncharacterized protein n=1 Tax=Verruconis gallopava TaxID=253628 RepID=A0A0D2APQ4_9PEZI|nr:uncharacterized protein PV09_01390 [Verruconis gallopava]KIW08495.1 hypothetical protein PV09_01390 [Verruconis gallopava]